MCMCSSGRLTFLVFMLILWFIIQNNSKNQEALYRFLNKSHSRIAQLVCVWWLWWGGVYGRWGYVICGLGHWFCYFIRWVTDPKML